MAFELFITKIFREMKNRLQFNRHYAEYQTRDEALTALNNRVKGLTDPGFIPLIGEPIVLRYKDGNGDLQLMLAVGKKAGHNPADREYHVIDTAAIKETIETLSGDVESRFVELSGVVQTNLEEIYRLIESDEEVTSAALNDLNERIIDNDLDIDRLEDAINAVSAYTNGVLTITYNEAECGSYSPSANTAINIDVNGSNVPMTGYEVATGETPEALEILPSDTVCEAAGKLQKQIIDDGEVTSAALNDLNERIIENEAATGEKFDELSGVTMILSGAADGFIDGAEYVSSAKTIIFTHANNVVDTIDATDFIKDGMVNNVAVVGTNLVITFNTDAGKEDIVIPLSEIFDPSLLDALSASVVYNTASIDVISGDVADLSASVVYNVTKINNVSGSVIDNAEKIEELSGSVVANEIAISALSETIETDEEVTAAALNDLNDRLITIEENGATSSELNDAIDNLSSELEDKTKGILTLSLNGVEQGKYSPSADTSVNFQIVVEDYVSGNGIDISNEKKVSVKLASKGDSEYIKADSDGLYLSGVSKAIDDIRSDAQTLSADVITYVNTLSGDVVSYVNKLSGDVVTYVNNLSGDVVSYVDQLSADTYNSLMALSGVVENDEEVIAAAFNDLNDRVVELEANAMNPDDYYNKNAIDEKLEDISISAGTFDPQFYYTKTDINNGVSASTRNLSGTTVSHVNNSDIHVTAVQKTAWTNGANSGASAWTAVNNLSAATTGIGQDVANLSAATVGISQKVTSLSAATTGIKTNLSTLSGVVESLSSNTADKFSEVDRKLGEISAGTGGDVSALSASVVSNKDKVESLSAATVTNAVYDSSSKKIYLKNSADQTVGTPIDATDFIKDGMVSAVTIAGGNMVISFNTDAGRQDITLALTDIFDPDDYYTKTEVDALSASVVTNRSRITSLSASVVSNKTKITNLSGSVVTNKTNITNLSGSVVTNKTDIANLSAGTVSVSGDIVTYVNSLSGDVVTYVNNLSAGTSVSLDELSASVVTNKTNLDAFSGGIIELEYVMAEAINDLNRRVIEISGQSVDLSDYYTTAQTYSKTEIMEFFSESGGNPDAAISALTESLVSLSAAVITVSAGTGGGADIQPLSSATHTHINNNSIHVSSSQKTSWTRGANSGTSAYTGFIAHSANTDIHVTAADKVTWNGKQDAINDLTAIRNNATSGANAYTGLTQLSGAVVNNYYTTGDTYTKTEVNDLISSSGQFVPELYYDKEDINDGVSASTRELSAATVAMATNVGKIAVTAVTVSGTGNAVVAATYANSALTLGKGNVQATISDLNTIRNNATSGADAYTGLSQLSGAVMNNYYTTGDTYTKTEVNDLISSTGQFVPELYYDKEDINDGVSASTKELSAATLNLSAVTLTGVSVNGTAVTVNNHVAAITGVLTAETQLSTASTGTGNVMTDITVSNHKITKNMGMTIPAWATASSKPSYSASEVGALPTGTTLDDIPDGTTRKLSGFASSSDLSALSAATVTLSGGAHSKITALSAGTVSGLNGKQDTITDLDAIRMGANSGASAWTAVTALSAATTALSSANANYFDGAEYVSSAKTIIFKHGTTTKSQIDASDFIKDGMVSSVTITGGNMVITFNTDAGHENITLSLTDIFNADNYYTKTQINTGVSATTKSLSGSVVALSAATYSHSGDTTRHITSAERTKWNNGANSGSSAWTAVTALSAATVNLKNNAITAETPVTVTKTGTTTGNVIGTISVDGTNDHQINYTLVSAATAAQVVALSAATTAHTANTTVHVTSNEKTYWTDGAGSGASAWTEVVSLGQKVKKTAEIKSSGSIYLDKGLTVYDIHTGTSSAKTLTLAVSGTDFLTNMTSGEVVECQIILNNSAGETGRSVTFTTQITGASIINTINPYNGAVLVQPGEYGEANAMIVKTGNNSYNIYLITS